jgi:hypothetical protein
MHDGQRLEADGPDERHWPLMPALRRMDTVPILLDALEHLNEAAQALYV